MNSTEIFLQNITSEFFVNTLYISYFVVIHMSAHSDIT
jgi:hypothetical protein